MVGWKCGITEAVKNSYEYIQDLLNCLTIFTPDPGRRMCIQERDSSLGAGQSESNRGSS